MKPKTKKIQRKKTKPTTGDILKHIDEDIIAIMELAEDLNGRLHSNEKTIVEISNYINTVTNTLNYCISSMFVYESYLIEQGADKNEIQREIDKVYFEHYQRTKKSATLFKSSTLGKINEKIEELQKKLNES